MATYGYRAPKPPVAPRVATGYQTQRQTTGYRDPFPSLAQAAQGQQAPRVTAPAAVQPHAQAPAARPAAPAVVNPTPQAPTAPAVGYSYDADPVLNQIQALSTQGREDATANALSLRRQLAQTYGDANLARQYGGETEATTAAQNPNSVLAQLSHSYDQSRASLEDQLNNANLFYSGARVKQLGDLANSYQGQVAGATSQEQGALGDITSNLAAALHAADLQDLGAQNDAYGRSLQAALAAGGTGTGPTTMDGVPLTVQGPGPMRPPDNPIEGAYPYGTQLQTTGPLAQAATGVGAVVPMGNFLAQGGVDAAALTRMLASGGGGASLAPPAPPKKKQHSYAGRAL